MSNLSWRPVRKGKIYCSSACGGGCTYEAYKKAQKNAEELVKLCQKEIGGTWEPVVRENLGWHWHVMQQKTRIAISYGGYLALGKHYSVGLEGGTPAQIFVDPNKFQTPARAYRAQVNAIKREASKWNTLLRKICLQ